MEKGKIGQLKQQFMEQVHSGASPTASAPTGILFVGREMPVVSRPPAYEMENREAPFGTGVDTHTVPLDTSSQMYLVHEALPNLDAIFPRRMGTSLRLVVGLRPLTVEERTQVRAGAPGMLTRVGVALQRPFGPQKKKAQQRSW